MIIPKLQSEQLREYRTLSKMIYSDVRGNADEDATSYLHSLLLFFSQHSPRPEVNERDNYER